MRPTEAELVLARRIEVAMVVAELQLTKRRNAYPNLGVTPALALAMQLNRDNRGGEQTMTTEPLTPAAPAADARRAPHTAGEHRRSLMERASGGAEELGPLSCLDKAADDEPVFVLRAQDRFAPDVVEHWAVLVQTRNGGRPTPKTTEARQLAKAMRQWQRVEQVDPDTGQRRSVDRSKVPD